MQARWHQPGRVTWIGLRPARRQGLTSASQAHLSEAGLTGDHARPGKRALTLIQAEHLAAIASFLGRASVHPEDLRRNLVIAGINLSALKGRAIDIGTARLRLTTICAPCSRMEETFGPGGYSALRGHGGWCAAIERPGVIRLQDPVTPVEDPPQDAPV
jgi:MOSC domain-containing protein YiiM